MITEEPGVVSMTDDTDENGWETTSEYEDDENEDESSNVRVIISKYSS